MAAGSMSAWMNAWEGDLTPSAAARRSAQREATRVAAHSRSSRYYGREATARLPEPMPETEHVEVVPVLQVVTRRRPRWGVVLVVLAFALLLVGSSIVLPVMVNSSTTEVETAVGGVEATQSQLAKDTAALAAEISALSSPQRVADQAARLGLVPATDVSYLAADPGSQDPEGETQVAGR
jgi:cell division protein FtsL